VRLTTRRIPQAASRPSRRRDNPRMDSDSRPSNVGHSLEVLGEGGIRDLLGYQLARAAIVTTAIFQEVVGNPLDLRPVEFTILHLVNENPAATATRIARTLSITTPGVTTWLDRLESRGLLARERSETDRRSQVLRVTEKGHALVRTALDRLIEAEGRALQHMGPAQRERLIELLDAASRTRAE
jgi:DNA-binding MarR family transcriptional regulator